jgi:hypothetical protein
MDARPTNATQQPSLIGRFFRFVKQLVVLSLLVAAVAVAAWFYGYNQIDEQIRAEAESKLRDHYRGLVVSIRSARRIEGEGVELRGVEVREAGVGQTPILVSIDEVFAECETKLPEFLVEPPAVRQLHFRRMKLRAERKSNGFWSLAHLIPLPNFGGPSPGLIISDASIEIAGTLTLRNINLTVDPVVGTPINPANPPADPQPARATAGTLLHVRGTLAGDHFERAEVDGLFDPESGQWDLRGAVESLEFNPRLRAALPREVAKLVEPLASVRGRTHFGFEVQRAALDPTRRSTPAMRFAIEGKISDGRIDDARLPDPLTEVEATLRCDNSGLTIYDLTARCGGAQLQLSADVQGYETTSPLRVELHAKQLQVDRLDVNHLSPQLEAVWSKFSPKGTIDIDAVLQFDGQAWNPDLSLRCHDLSVLYDRFQYRVTDGVGTIDLKGNELSVRMRAIGGGQVIRCRAEIFDPGENFSGWVELQSEGPVPIDEKLIAAMDYQGQKIVRSFSPRGGVSFHARFHRERGEEEVHRKLNLSIHQGFVQYAHFRYPIDNISGSLQLTDDDWVFHNLTGRNDSGYIVGSGHWLADAPDGNQLTLNFTATDVPLADELRLALSPGVQRLWANLRPRGNIDHLGVQIRYSADQKKLSLAVQAQKWPPGQNVEGRTISIEPAWFRYRLDNLTGSFSYRDGVVELNDLHAVHGRATLEAEGRCDIQPDGSCRVQLARVTADRVPVDHELITAMPPGIGDALSRLSLSAPVNMHGTLDVLVPNDAEQYPSIGWDMNFDVENCNLQAGLPIEHIHGGLQLVGRSVNRQFVSRGELRIDSAMVRDLQLTQIRGPVLIDPEKIAFGAAAERDVRDRAPRQITASVFGGTLTLDGDVQLTSETPFQLRSTLEGADLAQVMRELAPRQPALSGKVFGAVNLVGNGQGKHTYRGDGQIRLRDADIYELPLMIAMLKLLSVAKPHNRTAFTTSNIDFRIEGDDLEFDRIDFIGDAICLKGKGRMTGQREIDLKFYTQVGRDEMQLPIFRPVLGEASRQFMLIEVTGSLDQPNVHKTAFQRLNERLQELFPELAGQQRQMPEPTLPVISVPRDMLERRGLLPKR